MLQYEMSMSKVMPISEPDLDIFNQRLKIVIFWSFMIVNYILGCKPFIRLLDTKVAVETIKEAMYHHFLTINFALSGPLQLVMMED